MSMQSPPDPQIRPPASSFPSTSIHMSKQTTESIGVSGHLLSPTSSPIRLPKAPPPTQIPRTEGDGYFSLRSALSQSQQVLTASPSEKISTPPCLSSGLSSGRSFYSSDTGRSQASNSSEFLAPPPTPPDRANAPYKARRRSSKSLTMVRELREAKTIPDGEDQKQGGQSRRYNQRYRKSKDHECRNPSDWRPPEYHIAPTDPGDCRENCGDFSDHSMPQELRYSNAGRYGSLPHEMRSEPAPPVITRRWSSVEIATHQPLFRPKFAPERSPTPETWRKPLLGSPIAGKNSYQLYRDSTGTRTTEDPDVILAVQERLTHRKSSLTTNLETPASITLRRASGGCALSGIGKATDLLMDTSEPSKCTPFTDQYRVSHKLRPSATFLITNKDIDTIIEVVEANLKQRYQRHSPVHGTQYNTMPALDRKSSSCNHNDETTPLPTKSTIKVDGQVPNKWSLRTHTSVVRFQRLSTNHQDNDTILHKQSIKNADELIWDGGERSLCQGPMADKGHQETLPVKDNSKLEISQKQALGNGDLDASNAHESIKEWIWRSPRDETTPVIKYSDPDSSEKTQMTESTVVPDNPSASKISTHKERSSLKVRPYLRTTVSETKLKEVLSFPPLPERKETNDWYSPLPEMELSLPPTTSRPLYDLGLDITTRPLPVTAEASKTPRAHSSQIFPPRTREFDPSYDANKRNVEYGQDYQSRDKIILKTHPKVEPRTGSFSTIGSSIGVYSLERRKSSSPGIQRKGSPRLYSSASGLPISASSVRRQASASKSQYQGSPPLSSSSGSSSPGGRISPPSETKRKASPLLDTCQKQLSPADILQPRRPQLQRASLYPQEIDGGMMEANIFLGNRSSIPQIHHVRTIDSVQRRDRDSAPSRWRPPSVCPPPKPPSPSEYDNNVGSPIPMKRRNSKQLRSGWIERLRFISDRSAPSFTVDCTGIYGQMTRDLQRSKSDPCKDKDDLKLELYSCEECGKI